MDQDTLDSLAEDLSPLDFAILTLRLGYPLPVDLAATLMAQGYDPSQLESRYSN